MFNTAYETRPCRSYQMNEIGNALQRAIAADDPAIHRVTRSSFATGTDGKELTFSTAMVVDGASGVGLFAHPTVTANQMTSNYYMTLVDARDVTKVDYHLNLKVTSQPEYNLIQARAILQTKWSTGFYAGLNSLPYHAFPMSIYADWISDALTRRFNLDLEASVRVKALAAFMYLSMHQRNKEMEDYDLIPIATKIAAVTNTPANIVSDVISVPLYLADIDDFCDAVSTRIQSSRLEDINPVVLYSIIKGSWFGKNSAELAAVAVEHPPTFDALVYAAGSVSSFQRTLLGGLVKQELRNRDALSFIQKINNLILDKE